MVAYKPRKRRRRLPPNRHQGTGNTNKPGLVGTAGPSKPGLNQPSAAKPSVGGAPGVAAPAAPAAPPAPTGQHFVPDAAYSAEVDLATHNTEHVLSGLNDQERRTRFEFGLDDPTNPNSRAMAMKRAFLARRKGESVALAARGDLYSGTHERAQAHTRRDEEFATSELRRQYEDALRGINEARYQAKYGLEQSTGTAFENWLTRHQDEQPVVPRPESTPAGQKAASDKQKAGAAKAAAKAAARARARAKRKRKH